MKRILGMIAVIGMLGMGTISLSGCECRNGDDRRFCAGSVCDSNGCRRN